TSAGRESVAADLPSDRDIVGSALPLALDERHLAEILRADYLRASGGSPVGLSSIADYIESAALMLDNHPGYIGGIADLIDPTALAAWELDGYVRSSEEILNDLGEDIPGFYSRPPSSLTRRSLGGVSMVGFPGMTAPVGDIEVVTDGYMPRSGAMPSSASIAPFYIAENEVTNTEFARFVSENPEWSVENRGQLTSQGLADETYLSSWGLSGPQPGTGDEPVTWISWFAAEAYGKWFTVRFLNDEGLIARLPTEDEWEISARYNGIVKNTEELPAGVKEADQADQGVLGLRGMAGSVREWCFNPFRYNENRFRDANGIPGYRSGPGYYPSEKAVRGGSYIDSSLPYPVSIRGGLEASHTSPVVGFRLAAVQD
ncbi:MAG: SUMF1/EgtB/PvdO family nonheme iron enzyme, partial [Spirochaetaceae bacterium]|nr:SUMF1/EgtB/PvdO family nonheme iron enzyme [Spirochaetaceae bacterium]